MIMFYRFYLQLHCIRFLGFAAQYRNAYKSVIELQNEVDSFMSAYDAQEMEV